MYSDIAFRNPSQMTTRVKHNMTELWPQCHVKISARVELKEHLHSGLRIKHMQKTKCMMFSNERGEGEILSLNNE